MSPDLVELKARCTRFLSHHRPKTTREWLAYLAAMPDADQPPDTYGVGGAVGTLEREVADLLGKESAVFVLKGVIAQLAALRVWTDRSGVPTVAIHPLSHIELDEGDAYRRLHGLRGIRLGTTAPFRVDDLEVITERVGVVTVELPLRRAGFKLTAWDDLVAISDWCRRKGVPLHIDGARVWESAPHYGRSYAEIAALADSIYVSFYKGLGGLAGCILAGPADFIAQARAWKTPHGANLYTAFPYALAALDGLRAHLPRMAAYHARARALALELADIAGVSIAPQPPHTNAFQLYLPGDRDRLERAAWESAEADRIWLFGAFWETALPHLTRAEISVGDAIEEFSDDEVVSLIADLIERAQRLV